MYPVSDAYLAARRSRVREERITGGIKLKDGTIIAIDDSVIIQNSLSISKKVCSSSKFDIGTMNCSVLEMKLVDDSAYDHEFGGALIRLKYGIVTGVDEDGNKVWEEVPLPPFFADGSEVTRKWNVITITAYDPISLLNIDYPDTIPTDSLYSALQYVCNRAGIGLAITEDEFSLLPNSSVKPDFSSAQVVSCLDVAMWIAQTVNCCGFVDHRGLLYLKQYNYAGGNNYDRLFTEDEIKDIKYSDTRTYLAYLQAYAGDKVKLYSKVTTWTGSDASHTKEGALSLPKNPILSGLTDEEQAAVNSSYLENRSYPTRYIKMTGWVDPALELMDVVAFSGGIIDVGQIINVATQIKWCYGKSGAIYCASVGERSETAGEASGAAVMALAVTEEETSNSVNRVQPKSQIEKRLDDVEAQVQINASGAVGMKSPLDPTSEIFNCYEGDDKNDAGISGRKNYGTVRGLHNVSRGYTSEVGGNRNTESGLCNFVYGAQQKVENCSGTSVFNACNELKNASGAFVVGTGNIIQKDNSTIVGDTIFGYNNTVNGDRCFVFGHNNEISASDVFAFGNGLTTNPNDYAPQIIIGSGNVPSESTNKYVITVGTSTSSENKRNIFTLDWDGNIVCRSVTQTAAAATAALLSDDTDDTTTYSAQSDNVVELGGVTYTFTAAETGEYTAVTTSTGKSMKANIPAGLGNVQTHNAAFMALAMMSLK